MKKFLSYMLSVLLAVVVSMAAVGCSDATEANVTLLQNTATTVIIRADETDATKSLYDALSTLQSRGELTFITNVGDYGEYLQSLNGTALREGEYWAIYTSLNEYGNGTYSSTQFGSYEYGENSLGYANYGCSGLPLVEGNLYVVTLERYA